MMDRRRAMSWRNCLVLVLFAMLASLVGCGSDAEPVTTPQGTCTSNDACEAGEACREGVCEPMDEGGACSEDADCDMAPEPRCDGNVAVSAVSPGSCTGEGAAASCSYTEVRSTCMAGCLDGECQVEVDPCANVMCNAPPAAECEGDDLITFMGPGSCDAQSGDCSYMRSRSTCPNGCANGACEMGTCENVDCDMAPEAACDDEVVVSYSEMGMCAEINGGPECRYDLSFEHCGYKGARCDMAACVEPITQVGGLAISEVMAFPKNIDEGSSEWFEVVNVSGQSIDLLNWTIRSGTRSGQTEHTITSPLTIDDGARLLLANSSNPAGDGSLAPDYVYDDIALFFEDYIELVNPSGEVVDRLFWENGSALYGHARQFNPQQTLDAESNDDFSNWCPNLRSEDLFGYGMQNYGTPGAANTNCEPNPCMAFGCAQPRAYCDGDQTAVGWSGDQQACESSRFNNPYCEFSEDRSTCTAGAQLCVQGACEDIPQDLPAAGEVIFTEFMGNPRGFDTDGDWLELYNTTDRELSLFTLSVVLEVGGSASGTARIEDKMAKIPARSHVVLAVNLDPKVNGNLPSPILLTESVLKNGDDATMKLVTVDGTEIDAAFYRRPSSGNASQLDRSLYEDGAAGAAAANDVEANFCLATQEYDASKGDGTPGTLNESCN